MDNKKADSEATPEQTNNVVEALETAEQTSNTADTSATPVETINAADTPETPVKANNAAKTPNPTIIQTTEVAKTTESTIIFKATKPLMKEEFELLSDMVKYENEKTGLKIVLMPFSCEVAED
jgi:hypothetical protein